MRESHIQLVTRRWWSGRLGITGTVLDVLLAPAEALYRGAVAARNTAFDISMLRAWRAEMPVISVGNLTTGGTGKTPFAHYLAHLLRERGARPAILHGGYAPDEPELHRSWSADIPVIVDRDRVRGTRTAHALGADIAVLDDGFQHRRLHRDLDIVLLAVEQWTATYRVLPRGPWREPHAALQRADVLVVTRKTATQVQAAAVRRQLETCTTTPIVTIHFEPTGWNRNGEVSDPPREPAVAVAALAEPEIFRETASRAGATLIAVLEFADHHAYTDADAQRILQRANGAAIVTTEKDWIKLRLLLPRDRVWVLTQRVVIEHGADVLRACLDRVLGEAVPTRGAR